MSFQDEAATVKAHFAPAWTAVRGTLLWRSSWGTMRSEDVYVVYGNYEYDPPEPYPWLRLSVVTGDSGLAGLGGSTRMWRTVGAVVVQIFVAINSGEKIARQYADKVAAIFQGQQVGDLHFRAASLEVIGAQPSGAWWQANVNIPFYRDEHS